MKLMYSVLFRKYTRVKSLDTFKTESKNGVFSIKWNKVVIKASHILRSDYAQQQRVLRAHSGTSPESWSCAEKSERCWQEDQRSWVYHLLGVSQWQHDSPAGNEDKVSHQRWTYNQKKKKSHDRQWTNYWISAHISYLLDEYFYSVLILYRKHWHSSVH